MKHAYVFTRAQLEKDNPFMNGDRTRREGVLPPETVTRRLRDLFLLLDSQGTGVVPRHAVLEVLFDGCPHSHTAADTDRLSLLPWLPLPRSSAVPRGGAAAARASPQVGLSIPWTMTPPYVDFCGLLQLYNTCTNAEDAATAADAGGGGSPFARLCHATRSVRVDMSDTDVLLLARVFAVLDEGGKGYLDVFDIARGLAATTLRELGQQSPRPRSGSAAARVFKAECARIDPEEGGHGSPRVAELLSAASVAVARREQPIFMEMARKMMLAAMVGLPGLHDHDGEDGDVGVDSGARRGPGAVSGAARAAVRSRYVRVREAEAAAAVPLMVSLPVFIRSFQCATGAFPPALLHLAGARAGQVGQPCSPPREGSSESASVTSVWAGGATRRPTAEGLAESDKENGNMAGRAASSLNSSATPPPQLSFAASVTSGGPLANACGGGGPSAASISPFELSLLTFILSRYGDQLCTVEGEPSMCAVSPTRAREALAGEADADGGGGGRVHSDQGPLLPPHMGLASSSSARARPDAELRAASVQATCGPAHMSDARSSSSSSSGGGDDGNDTGADGNGSGDVDALADTPLHSCDASPAAPTCVHPPAAALLCSSSGLRPLWVEAARAGVALVDLRELETHLLLDLDPLYGSLEEVRWALVQRVCEVARTRALFLYRDTEVVNVDCVLAAIGEDPASIGLVIEPYEVRLQACVSAVESRLPRSALARVAELMVELGLNRDPAALESAEGVECSSEEALASMVALQQLIPVVLDGCLDASGAARAELARLFTSAAEPRLAAVRTPTAPPPDVCFLSLHGLLSELLARYLVACPPRRGVGPSPAFHTRLCRRLSSAEAETLAAPLVEWLRREELLGVGPGRRRAAYADEPMLFRTMTQHLLTACPSLCASRVFVAEYVASRTVRALRALPVHPAEADPPPPAGEDEAFVRERVFAPPSSLDGSLARPLSRSTTAAWEAWGVYSVERTLCAVGVDGCRQVSRALSSVPLVSDAPAEGVLETVPRAVVHEGDLVAALTAVLSGPLSRGVAREAGEGGPAHLHHTVWDIVGACPLVSAVPCEHTDPVYGPSRLLDVTRVLCRFLEAYPILPPSALGAATAVTGAAPLSSTRPPPSLQLCCRMTDAHSVYDALKRLVADGAGAVERTTGLPPPPSPSAAVSTDPPGPPLHLRSGCTDEHLTPVVSSATSRAAAAPPLLSDPLRSRRPPVRPIPFHRLAAILDAGGLLCILCTLGTQDALTGEVTCLSRVLKALSLTGQGVSVGLGRLGAAADRHGRAAAPASPAVLLDEGVGATLRARAVSMALPAPLQHAAVRLFCAAASTGPRGAARLSQRQLTAYLVDGLASYWAGVGAAHSAEGLGESLVALADRVFAGAEELPGRVGSSGSSSCRSGGGEEGGRRPSLSLDEFVAALLREHTSALAARLGELSDGAEEDARLGRRHGHPTGAGDVQRSGGVAHPALSALCSFFSPLRALTCME